MHLKSRGSRTPVNRLPTCLRQKQTPSGRQLRQAQTRAFSGRGLPAGGASAEASLGRHSVVLGSLPARAEVTHGGASGLHTRIPWHERPGKVAEFRAHRTWNDKGEGGENSRP